MTAPWLTVIMPIYNGAATLDRSLASLPGDEPGIEVLLVDQGSRDGSRTIAESHAGRLNLRIVDASQNCNWMQNTNLGLRLARARLVTMLHQDDIWHPGRAGVLKRLIARFPDAGMWLHAADYIDAGDHRIGRFAPPFGRREALLAGEMVLERLIVQNTIALPAVVFRRDLAEEGLDETLWYTADWDLWLRLVRRGAVAWSPGSHAGFRLHRGSLTVTGSQDLEDFRRQMDVPPTRHLDALSPRSTEALRPLIAASNALNLALARRFHGSGTATGREELLLMLLRLGPGGMWRLLRDTRIVARALPRLRLMWQGAGA